MTGISLSIEGDTKKYFFGDINDLGSLIASHEDVTITAEGRTVDKSPLEIPTKLVIPEGSTLTIEE